MGGPIGPTCQSISFKKSSIKECVWLQLTRSRKRHAPPRSPKPRRLYGDVQNLAPPETISKVLSGEHHGVQECHFPARKTSGTATQEGSRRQKWIDCVAEQRMLKSLKP